MKKTLIIAGLVAAALLASCAKVETPAAQQTIDLDLVITDFDSGADTKAVKTGWVNGDKLNLWFDGNYETTPDLILTYNGTKWVAGILRSGVSLKASGKMTVLYEGYNDLTGSSYPTKEKNTEKGYCNFFPKETSSKVDGHNIAFATNLWVGAQHVDYSYDSGANRLSGNINTWLFLTKNQVTVTGLTGSNWALMSNESLHHIVGVGVYNTGYLTCAITTFDNYILGVPNATNALAFYGGDAIARDSYTFTLYNLDTKKKYAYSVSGKTLNNNQTKLGAIVIPFSKFKAVNPELSFKKTSAVLGVHDLLNLKPYLVYKDIDIADITFSTSDSAVATVDGDMNIITNGKVGTAKITARASGVSATFNVETEDNFLMYVEETRIISGRGVLATGEGLSGQISVGDYVNIFTAADTTNNLHKAVTGIERLNKAYDTYSYGDGGVGLLLRGVEKADVPRGSLLMTPGSKRPIITTKLTLSIYMNTTEEGGRHTPAFVNYRPQLYVGTSDYTVALSDLGGAEMLEPGKSYDNITVDVMPGYKIAVFIGQQVAIRDVGKTVATCVVTDAVPTTVTY